jgi:hypothetical protein
MVAWATVPNTPEREEEDVPDIARLLPFNGKMVFQNSGMTPLLLILTFKFQVCVTVHY